MSKNMSYPLSDFFAPFREKVVGNQHTFEGPQGKKRILYADWTASGRLFSTIENRISNVIGPYLANTHTETSLTGKMMTQAYHEAKDIIKRHVNANENDVFLPVGTGMTGAIAKFQRLLGLKVPDRCNEWVEMPDGECPVIFVTHMEHHSNQTSWEETLAKVEVIKPTTDGLVDLNHLDELIATYQGKRKMIASVTGCSNVTGIETPYYEIARKMHRAGGLCFVDFACSGPYVNMDMHPENDADAYLDAIFFSPHKFLGGPGTPGALLFNKSLYACQVPDNPGGGTVLFTDPWGGREYIEDIEVREDGGTPGFLQTIKAAMCIKLKEEMTVEKMLEREHEILQQLFQTFDALENVHIFAGHVRQRLGVISFFIQGCHYNLGVKLLNDYFGIQTRGGCSCAGTYGHLLFGIDKEHSKHLSDQIKHGNLEQRPGWIRMSIHPTMNDDDVAKLCEGVEYVAENWQEMAKDYSYSKATNDFVHKTYRGTENITVTEWFNAPLGLAD